MNENYWNVLQHTHEWVRFADTKAGAVLAAQIAVFAVGVPPLIEHREALASLPCSTWILAALLVAAIISTGTSLWAIVPRLKVGEPKSLIFFAHIDKAYNSGESFSSHAREYYEDHENFPDQILEQVWAVSKVAVKKHRMCAISMTAFGFEFALSVALSIVALVN